MWWCHSWESKPGQVTEGDKWNRVAAQLNAQSNLMLGNMSWSEL